MDDAVASSVEQQRVRSADAAPDTVRGAADEYAVPDSPTAEDARVAQKAVVIHAPQQWPRGRYCVNCHDAFPCRLHRWGRRVLEAVGWTDRDVAELVRRAAAGDRPWS